MIAVMKGSRGTAVRLAAIALVVGGVSAVVPPSAASGTVAQRMALPGTHPGWAVASAARGAADLGARIDARLYLADRDQAALTAYAQAVASPSSALYHHYLTPAEFQTRFSPSGAEVRAVTGWLTAAGLQTHELTPDTLAVDGTVAAASRAFGTSFQRYAVGGGVSLAPAADATVPATMAPDVLAVTGLDNGPGQKAAPTASTSTTHTTAAISTTQTTASTTTAQSHCAAYWDASRATSLPPVDNGPGTWEPCGYTPRQLRGAYGVAASGLTGRGVTVAVVGPYDASTTLADANQFSGDYGLPALSPDEYRTVLPAAFTNGDLCDSAGWNQEQALNVEAVHTMATAARILWVAAASCLPQDFIPALQEVVDHRLATIVAGSWAWPFDSTFGNLPAELIDAFQQIFVQGAAEGIGFYFATGDCSDLNPANPNLSCASSTGTTQTQTEFPAADPWVTAVGGTSLAVGADSRYLFETGDGTTLAHELPNGQGWVTPSVYQVQGGGGGVSPFPQPAYQKNVVPSQLATSAGGQPMRVIPDVAMDADFFTSGHFGATVTGSGGQTAFVDFPASGTGFAVSLFAGVQADAQQARGGIPIGFANPALYARGRPGGFHDVTDRPFGPDMPPQMVIYNPSENAYAEGTLGDDDGLHATKGYDDATGLGSPSLAYFRSFH